MKHAGINMGSVKKQNRSSILKYINGEGPVSRKDIAIATGLTPAAVTQICTDFIEQGILIEKGVSTEGKGAGRRKILVDIEYNYRYVFAVNIEPEVTVVALANLKGELLSHKTIQTDNSVEPEVFLKTIANMCKLILEENASIASNVAGISVGIIGIVDREKKKSLRAYGIWKQEVRVCEILEKELGLYTIIENNVNAFALAELFFGIGREFENLLVIKWGPGVGSTIVIDNKIYEGRHEKAAEIGHCIVEKDGDLCKCGRYGCLETKVSYNALNKKMKFAQEDFEKAYRQAELEGKGQIFDEAIDLFARTIVNAVTILAPNRVVLSGLMFHGEKVRNKLIEECKKYELSYDENRIIYSSLAGKEDYIGPIAKFVQEILY